MRAAVPVYPAVTARAEMDRTACAGLCRGCAHTMFAFDSSGRDSGWVSKLEKYQILDSPCDTVIIYVLTAHAA